MNSNIIEEHAGTLSRRGLLTGVGLMAAAAAAAAAAPKKAYAQETAPTATAQNSTTKKIFDGVELSMGRIVHDPDKCAGCRDCEIVCSLAKLGKVDPEQSNIRIKTDYLGGYISEAYACKQCAGAECLSVCPTGALHTDEKTGARVIDQNVCVGCQLCLNACPVEPSRIHYNPATNTCMKCDLCGGEPQCVQHCPAGALTASWEAEKEDDSIVKTPSGVVVNVALTGGIISIAPDSIQLSDINVEKKPSSVVLSGKLDSTYTQPFPAKIKVSYFDEAGDTLFFSERQEIPVDVGGSITFEDSFETSEPDKVTECNLEVMCGKIAG